MCGHNMWMGPTTLLPSDLSCHLFYAANTFYEVRWLRSPCHCLHSLLGTSSDLSFGGLHSLVGLHSRRLLPRKG